MNINLPQQVIEIIKKLEDAGFEAYIVGGAVRDLLMGRVLYDWDLTTNATPEKILEIFGDEAFYDNKFGKVGIKNEDERPYEITTFRSEFGYSDSRRPDKIQWGKTLDEDLKRRDFTINALALRLVKSAHGESHNNTDVEIIDLFGGQKDLEGKLIRAVGDPFERFSEDALRMMRAVRIASELDFKIEEKTLFAINENAALIHKISRERVRDELLKTLASAHPYEGIQIFRNSGLLAEVLPELDKTFGIDQKSPGRHHIYDVGTHCIMALKFCPSTDPIVRFATLIHDAGKAQTYKKLENGTITFYNHELVSARIAKNIADRLRFSNEQKDKFWRLVRFHQFTVNENQTDSAIRRFIRNVTPQFLTDMIDLRVGDRLGGGASETSWRLEEFKIRLTEVQKQPFSIRDLKVDGNDVMKVLGIKPGPKVGEILEKIFSDVEEKKTENEKGKLLLLIEEYKN
ncbi:MAG: tRNA adenylyl-/cytidylyl-transferase [Microgenomates group bacterium GW2011_GWC1_37_12b]|uniref:tRNA adenylyl-/cytidylyl-transferase n=1 Tax=Candidatus Woesebacteria bacterium GW2011_GWB1_38_8b TaxID=1618571 RepID=A0A0G0L5J3_9BACT|nr:MAG: tRNA adenylyl-/cytidylyl-transferase [Microgenomates group bacterium GW2011_GWC1_37_12b]KKQ87273.1 MAG: tRNA adenylyl-/cytidylyl-transferase [Candidatus Woesebacteria bacterium GW2011_GWB1_38_8b]